MSIVYDSEEVLPRFVTFHIEPGVVLVRTSASSSIDGEEVNAKWFPNGGYITVNFEPPLGNYEPTQLKIEKNLEITDYLLKDELQEVAQHLGLSTSGLKAEIIDRIKQHLGIE